MTTNQQPMYPDVDPEDYAEDFVLHMQAMTAENLYRKSDIAVQLAWRDAEIRKLREELELEKQLYLELEEKHCSMS